MTDTAPQGPDLPASRISEAHYQAVFASAAVGMSRVDPDGRILELNQALQGMLGYTATELLGKRFAEITDPTDARTSLDNFRELVEARLDSYTMEKRYLSKDGRVVWANTTVSAVRDADGRLEFCIGIIQDITEHKLAEQALQESEDRYRSLFDGVADAILVAGSDGRFLDANSTAVELLGYTRPELLAMHVGDLAADPEHSRAAFQRLRQDGHVLSKVELRRKDGSLVPLEGSLSAVQLASEVVYLAVWRDISERQALERMQQEFIALAAHELKNPLAALSGYGQLMQRMSEYDERVVVGIVSQTARLQRLIDDLLDVSRLQRGRLDLRRAPVDIVALAQAAAEQARVQSQQHIVRIETEQESVVGWWDHDRLAQVLENLVSNALKYTSPGEIVIKVDRQGSTVEVSVADNGPGIPSNALPHLFERFYRAEAAQSGSAQGFGLGLYISKLLVEAHGGAIAVESDPARGSVFTFSVPLGVPGLPSASP